MSVCIHEADRLVNPSRLASDRPFLRFQPRLHELAAAVDELLCRDAQSRSWANRQLKTWLAKEREQQSPQCRLFPPSGLADGVDTPSMVAALCVLHDADGAFPRLASEEAAADPYFWLPVGCVQTEATDAWAPSYEALLRRVAELRGAEASCVKEKKLSVSERMMLVLTNDKTKSEASGWSAQQWADSFGCSKSTVVESHAWKNVLRPLHEQCRTDKVAARREIEGGGWGDQVSTGAAVDKRRKRRYSRQAS